MVGYTELLAARLNGFAPASVWVHVLDCEPSYYLKRDAQEAIANGYRVSLLILPNESIAALDLSALTGLRMIAAQGALIRLREDGLLDWAAAEVMPTTDRRVSGHALTPKGIEAALQIEKSDVMFAAVEAETEGAHA